DAEARRDHCLDPVLSRAPADDTRLKPLLAATFQEEVAHIAIRAKEEILVLQVAQPNDLELLEAVAPWRDYDNALPVKPIVSKPLVGPSDIGHHRRIQIAAQQQVVETWERRFDQRQLYAEVLRTELPYKRRQPDRPDAGHDPQLKNCLPAPQMPVGSTLGALRVRQDLLEHGPHKLAELGQVGEAALAVDQRSPQLLFELLDRASQRRLRDVTLLSGPREVQRLAKRNKIADLVQLQPRQALLSLTLRAVHLPGGGRTRFLTAILISRASGRLIPEMCPLQAVKLPPTFRLIFAFSLLS